LKLLLSPVFLSRWEVLLLLFEIVDDRDISVCWEYLLTIFGSYYNLFLFFVLIF